MNLATLILRRHKLTMLAEELTGKAKATAGLNAKEAEGYAKEKTGEAKGAAAELKGQAKGKAEELKSKAS